MLALIPARGASKGLPGKNLRPFAGLPLVAHSILLAGMCPDVRRTIVSTDDPAIADVARRFGAEVPFLRPAELARDETPMWPVVQHALGTVDPDAGDYDFVLLLDPTSPGRLAEDVRGAYERLRSNPEADGVVGVSRPDFNPIWHCVVERDGWMAHLIPDGAHYDRRQDAPAVYRINASLYIWRAAFVRRRTPQWVDGRHLLYEIPEARAFHIDDLHTFEQADAMVRLGLVQLPWLDRVRE